MVGGTTMVVVDVMIKMVMVLVVVLNDTIIGGIIAST